MPPPTANAHKSMSHVTKNTTNVNPIFRKLMEKSRLRIERRNAQNQLCPLAEGSVTAETQEGSGVPEPDCKALDCNTLQTENSARHNSSLSPRVPVTYPPYPTAIERSVGNRGDTITGHGASRGSSSRRRPPSPTARAKGKRKPAQPVATLAANYRRQFIEKIRRQLALAREYPGAFVQARRAAAFGPNADKVLILIARPEEGLEGLRVEVHHQVSVQWKTDRITDAEVVAELKRMRAEQRGARPEDLEESAP